MSAFKRVTEQLERSLGPDTGDLSIRVGLHSGPVTAGVLRGERVSSHLVDSQSFTPRELLTNLSNFLLNDNRLDIKSLGIL